MIFNTQEGPTQDEWDPEDLHIADPTPEQQNDELLRQAHIGLEKLRIQKLELETLDLPEDQAIKRELSRIHDSIQKQQELIVSLGGEMEVQEK